MSKSGLTWLIIVLGLVTGFFLVWQLMPEHKRVFWRNFIRQIPDLPGRYLA